MVSSAAKNIVAGTGAGAAASGALSKAIGKTTEDAVEGQGGSAFLKLAKDEVAIKTRFGLPVRHRRDKYRRKFKLLPFPFFRKTSTLRGKKGDPVIAGPGGLVLHRKIPFLESFQKICATSRTTEWVEEVTLGDNTVFYARCKAAFRIIRATEYVSGIHPEAIVRARYEIDNPHTAVQLTCTNTLQRYLARKKRPTLRNHKGLVDAVTKGTDEALFDWGFQIDQLSFSLHPDLPTAQVILIEQRAAALANGIKSLNGQHPEMVAALSGSGQLLLGATPQGIEKNGNGNGNGNNSMAIIAGGQ